MIYDNKNVYNLNNYSLIGKNPSKNEKYSDDEKKTAKDLFKKKVQQGLLYHDYNLRNHPVCKCEVGRDIDRAVKFPCKNYGDLHCTDSYYIDNLKILDKINSYVQENNLHMVLIVLENYHHNTNYYNNESDYDLKKLYKSSWSAFKRFINRPLNLGFRELKDKINCKYSIYNFECNYNNIYSWNPHRNILLIGEKPLSYEESLKYEEQINDFWAKCVTSNHTANKNFKVGTYEGRKIKEDVADFHNTKKSPGGFKFAIRNLSTHYKGVHILNEFKNIFYIADRNKLYQGFNGLKEMKNRQYDLDFSYSPYVLGCRKKTQHLYKEFLDLPVKLTIDSKIATREAIFTYNDNLLSDLIYSDEEIAKQQQKKQDDKLIKEIRKRLKVNYDLEFLTYLFEKKHFTPQILADKLKDKSDDEVETYVLPFYNEFKPVFDNYLLELQLLEESNNFQLPSIKHRNKYFRHYLNHWYPFSE